MTDSITDDGNTAIIHLITSDHKNVDSKIQIADFMKKYPPVLQLAAIRMQTRMSYLKRENHVDFISDYFKAEDDYSEMTLIYTALTDFNLSIAEEIRRENEELRTDNRPWIWYHYQFARSYSVVSHTTSESMTYGNVLVITMMRMPSSAADPLIIAQAEKVTMAKLYDSLSRMPDGHKLKYEQQAAVDKALERMKQTNLDSRYPKCIKRMLTFLLSQDESLEVQSSTDDSLQKITFKVYSELLSEVPSSILNSLLQIIRTGSLALGEVSIKVCQAPPKRNIEAEKRKMLVARRTKAPTASSPKTTQPPNWMSRAIGMLTGATTEEDEEEEQEETLAASRKNASAGGPGYPGESGADSQPSDFFILCIQLQSSAKYTKERKSEGMPEIMGKGAVGDLTPLPQFRETPIVRHRVAQSPIIPPRTSSRQPPVGIGLDPSFYTREDDGGPYKVPRFQDDTASS